MTEDHALVSKAAGCVKPVFLSCLALLSVCSLCAIYLFAPLWFWELEVQRSLDNIRQRIQLPFRAQKESDLIAIACHPPRDYGTDLYTVHPDGTHLRLASSSILKTHYSLDWSPDGIWLAMNMKNEGYWSWIRHWTYESPYSEVYIVRFDGSVIRRLTYSRNDEHDPRWSKDGTAIFFDSDGLHSVSANGGDIKQLNQLSREFYSLPQNGLLLSTEHNRTGDPALNYTLHRDASGLTLLVNPESPIAIYNPLQWFPNDAALFYSDQYKGVRVYYTKTLRRMDTRTFSRGPAGLSPNGKWLAIIGLGGKHAAQGEWIRISDEENSDNRSRRHLSLLDIDTGQLKAFIYYIKFVGITWSPDSKWIAFVSSSNDGQLFKIKRDGTGLQQLTDLDCDISEISWSPK